MTDKLDVEAKHKTKIEKVGDRWRFVCSCGEALLGYSTYANAWRAGSRHSKTGQKPNSKARGWLNRYSEESFLARINRPSDDACWEWTGSCDGDGYGMIEAHGKRWKTHRLMWTIKKGPIPAGMFVCHTCDNPPCCNPAHLWLGTNEDNIADASLKGRMPGRPYETRITHGELVHECAKCKEKDEELKGLREQLPEGMKEGFIIYKRCAKGHGWLTARNWVQHECPHCSVEAAESRAAAAEKERDELRAALSGRTVSYSNCNALQAQLAQSQIEILKHARTMVSNATLGEKSQLRRDGIRKAAKVIDDLIYCGVERAALRQSVPASPAKDLREELAALCHEQWSGWMKYLFSKATPDGRELPQWAVDRWSRQAATPYENLSEEEKESDRKEADRILAVLVPASHEAGEGFEVYSCPVCKDPMQGDNGCGCKPGASSGEAGEAGK